MSLTSDNGIPRRPGSGALWSGNALEMVDIGEHTGRSDAPGTPDQIKETCRQVV